MKRNVHGEEFVLSAAGDRQGAKFVLDLPQDAVGDGRILVGDHGVVDVPADGALRAVDVGVGNSEVVRVDDKAHVLEGGREELVPKHAAHDKAVDGLVATNV